MELFDVMQKGGVLMWLILLCALVAIGVVIERWLVIHKARMDAAQFMLKLKSIYRHADLNAVLAYCSQKEAPIVAVVRRGIAKLNDGDAKIREAMEGAGREELYRLERRMTTLASLCGAGPMLGFLGAVVAMLGAFQSDAGQAAQLAPRMIGDSIHAALLCMGFGLGVGVLSLVGYNMIVARVQRIAHDMEVTASDFLDMLDQGPAGFQATVTQGTDGPTLSRSALETEPEFFRRKVT
jgi:biopolymer transport protein ExbB